MQIQERSEDTSNVAFKALLINCQIYFFKYFQLSLFDAFEILKLSLFEIFVFRKNISSISRRAVVMDACP